MILSLAFLIAVSFDVTSPVPIISSTMTFGNRVTGDQLCTEETISAPYNKNWFRVYEQTFNCPSGIYISQIIAKDQKLTGPYGRCKIIRGGPGWRHVTMRFKSQINKPIHFRVTVYGHWISFILDFLIQLKMKKLTLNILITFSTTYVQCYCNLTFRSIK